MENITDKIQDYIDGTLGGEDLVYFENQMLVDEELRNLVALQTEVHAIINRRVHSGEKDFRAHLKSAHANREVANKRPNRILKLYVPIVAAACLVLFFGLFFFNNDSSLYSLPVMQSEVVRGDQSNASYEDAVKAFNAEKYADARTILAGLITKEPTVIQYQYYEGLTYFGEQKWQETVEALKNLAEGESIYANDARYYLAVSYWKLNDRSKAEEWAKQIPNTGKLGDKKEALLKKMK